MTTWIDGLPFGPGVWRDVVPATRTIRLGTAERTSDAADAPQGQPGASKRTASQPARPGRPRKGESSATLERFLATCERVQVDGVLLMWALCDALRVGPKTVEKHASAARKAGRFPWKFAAAPWRTDGFTRNRRGARSC